MKGKHMSYTEIYGFNKEENAYFAEKVKNSWRGAMAIWLILEEKYLPPFRPSYVPSNIPDSEIKNYCGYKPSRYTSFNNVAMKEIWNLVDDKRLSKCEKIVLASTFDNVIVKKENMPKLISAFKEFEGDTLLKEQSDVIETLLQDENCIAVGFNQTSTNGTTWVNRGGYDENQNPIPYNILTGDEHWELFNDGVFAKQ